MDARNQPEKAARPDAEEAPCGSGEPGLGRRGFSRIVANLTHELKTPLHSILAVVELLAAETDGPLTPEQKRQVEMIRRNGRNLLELIIDLLNFSRSESDPERLRFTSFQPRRLFEEVVDSVRPLASQNGITIESDLERLAEGFFSDRTVVRRIVGNLVGNAVKFSPDGGLVSVFAESLKDGALSFQIADSGIGIPPEIQSSIFTEFYQAEAGDARRFGGVGLGLSLVQRAVQLLGGSIEVKSEADRGSIFVVSIPSAEASVPKKKILVADEDESVCFTLSECFRTEHCLTVEITEQKALLSAIAHEKPDLIILGFREGSLSLLEQLRASAWGQEIPIIIMSALDSPAERSRAFELGASDFIVKPFNVGELRARVRGQLERSW